MARLVGFLRDQFGIVLSLSVGLAGEEPAKNLIKFNFPCY